ncbi:MAG: hypothetical protein NXI10_07885 [bacterium]|nr:hypothetical protein [bacterium]
MKNLLLLPLFLTATFFTCAGNDPYKDAAKEMCGCVNESMSFLSERMIDIIVSSEGDQELMEAELEKYVEDDLEAAMQDVEVLQGPMLEDMTACFNRVSADYEDRFSEDSEEVAEEKLLEAMKGLDQCKSSVVFFKLGMSSDDNMEEETSASSEMEPPVVREVNSDYVNISREVCDCVSESTEQLSPRIREIFINSQGDPTKLEQLIEVYASEDEEGAMKDAELLQGEVATDIDKCMARIESNYGELYESTGEEEIQKEMLLILEDSEGCEMSASILSLSLQTE